MRKPVRGPVRAGATVRADALSGLALGLALLAVSGCEVADTESTGGSVATEAESGSAAYVNDDTFLEEVFESALPVLVDFTATWCAPCKEVDPIVDELAAQMDGKAKVVKLDIDESPNIYRQLNVNGVPTVIFFNEGREEDRISGAQRREIYVKYLAAMVEGSDMLDTRLELLSQDEYREHFILSRELDDIEAMLPHRADLLTQPFADGRTPLSAAIKRPSVRQEALIALILSRGPDIGLHDLMGIGRCEDFLAAVETDPELANRPDADGASPLWLALMAGVRKSDAQCALALLESGANPAQASDSKYYLPRAVLFFEDPLLLGQFLDSGMDPAQTDGQGMNALHLAAMYGYYPLVETLLNYGMNPEQRNGDGDTAAEMIRARHQRREELWLERGPADSPDIRAAIQELQDNTRRMLELLETRQT
ncbi:thioredoxin domain-containing protein [Candidatus Foliamicus sp.]